MPVERIEYRERFWVAGHQVRTSNAAEADPAAAQIPGLWQRFFEEHITSRTRDRLDDAVLAVYHDYESDHSGEYSLTVGCPVRTLEGQPGDLALVRVPAQRYAVVRTERGPIPGIVIDAWRAIWSMTPEALGGPRAYEADFEVYDEGSADPADAQVEIWIGLEA